MAVARGLPGGGQEAVRRRKLPDKAWGRCEYGSAQAGAHWSPRPPGQRFSFYALDEQAFAAKNEELAAKGYTLQYDHTFQECDGATRHQALWMKGG